MNSLQRFIFSLLLALICAGIARADKRVALVIGNSAYQHTTKLANPKNDAVDMAAALKKHSFQVIEGFDLDKEAFDRKADEFIAQLEGVGLFFYAGHALQLAGQNYLVPIDAELASSEALDSRMVRLDRIHRLMEAKAPTNIVFLDACRDNPLARNLKPGLDARPVEIGRGLAEVQSGVGTLISFSTQPGNSALDGIGRNSPFTGALVKHLSIANDDLNAILMAVRNDVMQQTDGKQVPWEHSALTARFYFGPRALAPPPPHEPRSTEVAEAWDRIKDTKDVTVLELFVKRYEGSFFADVARARIRELEKQTPAPGKRKVGKDTRSAKAAKPDTGAPKKEQMCYESVPASRLVPCSDSRSSGRIAY